MNKLFKVKLKVNEQWAIEWDGTEEMYNYISEFDRYNSYFYRKGVLCIISKIVKHPFDQAIYAHKTNIIIFGNATGNETYQVEVFSQKEYYASGCFFDPFFQKYERIDVPESD